MGPARLAALALIALGTAACEADVLAGPDQAPVDLRVSSIEAPARPLVIVDGVPLSEASRLSDLRHLQIIRIEVIKAPAAVRLYGEEASRGAIVIFTAATPGRERTPR
jgi:outer membrane receptor for Fe3+-dicitrate